MNGSNVRMSSIRFSKFCTVSIWNSDGDDRGDEFKVKCSGFFLILNKINTRQMIKFWTFFTTDFNEIDEKRKKDDDYRKCTSQNVRVLTFFRLIHEHILRAEKNLKNLWNSFLVIEFLHCMYLFRLATVRPEKSYSYNRTKNHIMD